MDLSERKRRILQAIINAYIDTAEPIGSKSLIEREGLEFSSATIRHEMAELEELGLLYQPHTSAGRIPSNTGFRFYIDCLMPQRMITNAEKELIERIIGQELYRPDRIINRAAIIASEITGCAAIAVTPAASNDIIRHFEAVPVSDRCSALMAVTGSGIVKTVMVKLKTDTETGDYSVLNKILYKYLCGININDIGDIRLCMIENEILKYCPAFSGITSAVTDFVNELNGVDIHISGESKVLSFPEFCDINKAKALFDFLHSSEDIKKILLGLDNDSVNIILGSESGYEELADISFISAGYNIGDRNGLLAVIGPMRINYAKVISDIKYFTYLLSKMISDTLNNTEK